MTWTPEELTLFSTTEEIVLTVAPSRRVPRRGRKIWVVREGDDLYVRSLGGPASGWYQSARTRRKGSIRVGGVRRDVSFAPAGPEVRARVDAEYRRKYGHYASAIIDTVTGGQAASTTLRLLPCSARAAVVPAAVGADASGRGARRRSRPTGWQALFDRPGRQCENA